MGNSELFFSDDGPLAKEVAGYRPRWEQQQMATAIEQAVTGSRTLIVEAGTGIGKTFAYLVPILLSEKKTIISTGTKNLQDQLYHRDIPTVLKALGRPIKHALLKGRANYLCPYRLQMHMDDGRFQSRQTISDIQIVRQWAGHTRTGDISELSEIADDAEVWPLVTSTNDNCLGSECPMWEECPVVHARRKALDAELVVVNHHLFFADASLKGEGVGELLPGMDAVVFDEAHQLPQVASNFFGSTLSARQLLELSRDTYTEIAINASDQRQTMDLAKALEHQVMEMRLAFADDPERRPWFEVAGETALQDAIAQLSETLKALQLHLDETHMRSKGLDSCWRRCKELRTLFDTMTQTAPEGHIHWYETFRKTFTIYLTPLSIAETFQTYLEENPCAWIFTSATLAVDQQLEHFAQQLGITDYDGEQFESPFDYPHNALFYAPRGLPDPNAMEYTEKVVQAALPVLQASRGRAFMLFTSHRALQTAAALLQGQVRFPLFVQGSKSKSQLLTEFRQAGNGVLLGTNSFWEGVDVRGEALSCVIIDKLPFGSPFDPVVKARLDAMKKEGRNPFWQFQIPEAVITLKQGAGRLIRDVADRGVLMLCDPRLVAKQYGQVFLKSLPPMRRTRDLAQVQAFFAESE